MSNPSDKIRSKRADLSPYLFNFLRDEDAPEVLSEILTTGILKSIKHPYICFTDAPITCYLPNLEYFNSWKEKGWEAMFTKYGIGISRDWLFEKFGARPVIYGSQDEEELLDESIKWRFQSLDIKTGDWSWLREWRINSNVLDLNEIPREQIIVIVPEKKDQERFLADYEIKLDFIEGDGQYLPYAIEKHSRVWKGYSIDQISKFENDFELSAHTATQKICEEFDLACE